MYVIHKLWFVQSMDHTAQSLDPCFVQQSMDYLLNPWIAQNERHIPKNMQFMDVVKSEDPR